MIIWSPTVRTGGAGAGDVVIIVAVVDERLDRWQTGGLGDDIYIDIEEVDVESVESQSGQSARRWFIEPGRAVRIPLARPRPRSHRRRRCRRHVQTRQRSQHFGRSRPRVIPRRPRCLIVRHFLRYGPIPVPIFYVRSFSRLHLTTFDYFSLKKKTSKLGEMVWVFGFEANRDDFLNSNWNHCHCYWLKINCRSIKVETLEAQKAILTTTVESISLQ